MRYRLVSVVLALAALVAVYQWWASDRRQINRQLARAETLMEKEGEEDQLTAFGKVRKIVGLFTRDFVVLARPYEGTLQDRQELAGVIAHYRGSVVRLKLAEQSKTLEISAGRGAAEMRLVLKLSTQHGGADWGRQSFDFRISWAKEDDEWRIHEAELLAVETGGGSLRF